MKETTSHRTLDGRLLSLDGLSPAERKALAEIRRAYAQKPDWAKFTNVWRNKMRRLYRRLPPGQRTATALYRVGEDLEARLGVHQKYFRSPDYRDQLLALIVEHFPSRYAFCRATGLDQAFISRLLRKSTNISVDRLNRALRRIGWELSLAPTSENRKTAA